MAEYRNSLKNKENIKKAFVQLVAEKKDISKVTIRDIAEKADISKSTFYSHYVDIYALLAEIQQEILTDIGRTFDDCLKNKNMPDFQPFAEQINKFLRDDNGFYSQLYLYTATEEFLKRVRNVITEKLEATFINKNNVNNSKSIYFYINILANGLIYMTADYYHGEISLLTQDEIISNAVDLLDQMFTLAKTPKQKHLQKLKTKQI